MPRTDGVRIVESVPVAAPPERVIDLVRSVDLHERTSAPIRGRAVGGRTGGRAEPGDQTTWRATFFGVRPGLTVETAHIEPGVAVVERLAGSHLPLAAFGHTYRADRRPGGCVLWDAFTVRLAGGAVGEAATLLLLRRRMTALVRHRLREICRLAEGDEWRAYVPAEPRQEPPASDWRRT